MMGPAVRQAAGVARALEGRVPNRPKLGEPSAVKAALTLADSASQETILVPLLEHFPDVALRAEEDTPSVVSFAREGPVSVVVDPIDGTLRSYLEGGGPYAVMVGLCVEGRYEAALVALPREGLFFDAPRGGPARRLRPGGALRPVRVRAEGRRVLVSYDLPEAAVERLVAAGLEPFPACGGAIAVAPLVPGVRGGLRLAPGASGVSVRGRIGLVIARAAGVTCLTEHGVPFPEALSAPAHALAVAADEEDAELLREAAAAGLAEAESRHIRV